MLTRKQHELLTYIHDKLGETGVSPSFEEMKEALELKSKSGVHRLISALEERGFLRRLPNRARALEILRMPDVKAGIASSPKAPVAPPACRSRRSRGKAASPSPPLCLAPANIMPWKWRATRWSRKAFSTAITR